ncbi:MAG: cold-shock protein [Candidatus Bathyarchaeia archaeon]
MKGKVKKWLTYRGFGFIEPEEGDEDIFVHSSEIQGAFDLREGEEVKFDVEETPKGPRAINVEVVH